MHWKWKNYPTTWKGQYRKGDHDKTTIMLETVASHDIWIWQACFDIAGSNNNINVLNQSNVFNEFLQGQAPEVKFTINGITYNKGYYLIDDIHSEWVTFVKSIPKPLGKKIVCQTSRSSKEKC